MRFSAPLPAVSAVSAALLLMAASVSVRADPNDIVPHGDIAYDQLGALAAAGRLPETTIRDFARGDRLYTRAEVAAFIRDADAAGDLPPDSAFSAALRALHLRFGPELLRLGDSHAKEGTPSTASLLTGQVKVRALTGPAAGDAIFRTSLTTPFGRDGFAAVSLGDWRDEWYVTRRGGSKNSFYPLVETAFARVNGRALDVSVGVSPLRWGSGYAGSLLLNDDMPSVPRIQIEKGFYLPGKAGSHLGQLYFTEFIGQFFEDSVAGAAPDATGSRRYLGGRRIEAGGGPWTFSASESFKSTRLPGAEWAAVLPTFYEYQNDWSKSSRTRVLGFLAGNSALPDTFWFNYVADAGATYHTGGRTGTVLYVDALLDDIKAPQGIGLGDDTPRKLGYQIGANIPRIDSGGRYGLRLEYARIDPRTYTDVSIPIQWTNDGVPIGYPAGSRVRSLFGRLDAAVSQKVKLAAEAEDRKSDGSGAVLPPVEPLRRRISLFGTYALRRDWFLGARYENRRYTSGATETVRNRAEANIGYGF